MESKIWRPDPNHAPTVSEVFYQHRSGKVRSIEQAPQPRTEACHLQQDYANHDCVEHCLCAESKPLLSPPERIDANCLCSNAHDEKIGQCECVVGHNGVLQSGDYGNGCIQRVTQEEVA